MMLFLIVNIPHYSREILLAKRQNPIFILPVKFKVGFDNVVDVMRTIPFDISNKFCRRNLWWDRHRQMHMLFGSADGMNETVHLFRFCNNGTI